MRYQSLRSVVRAAIAAGLVASCQSVSQSANWKDFLQPFSGACFVHDMNWEQYGVFRPQLDSPEIQSSILSSTSDSQDKNEITAIENERCIAAAKQFELRSQLNASWTAIQSRARESLAKSEVLFNGIANARILFTGALKSQSLALVTLVQLPDALPVTVLDVVPTESELVQSPTELVASPVQMVSQSEAAEHTCSEVLSATSEFIATVDDTTNDWNCTDWNRDCNPMGSTVLPTRDHANIFLFTLDTSSDSGQQVTVESNAEIVPQDVVAIVTDEAQAPITDVSSETSFIAAAPENNIPQFVADTASPTLDSTPVPYTQIVAESISAQISETNTVSGAETLAETVAETVQANPISDDSNKVVESDLPAVNIWQVGVDPVCPEIHSVGNTSRWSELAEQPSICCPIDNMAYEATSAANELASSPIPDRPPTLDADFDTSAPLQTTQIVALEPQNVPEESSAQVSVVNTPPTAEENQEATTSEAPAIQDVASYVRPWSPWLAQGFVFDGNSPRISESESKMVFAKSDLEHGALISERILDSAVSEPNANVQIIDSPILEPIVTSDVANNIVSESPTSESNVYAPKDFLIYRNETSQNSILLPANIVREMSLSATLGKLWIPATESRLLVSKSLARSMKSVGQLLVDFGQKLEIETERIEIAGRDSNQR